VPDQRRFTPLFPSYRSTLANLLGLRLIATGVPIEEIDRTLRPGEWTPVARTPDGFLYENPHALPRVLVAARAVAVDQDALLRDGRWPEVDLGTTVLLSGIPPGAPAATPLPAEPGRATVLSYGTTDILVSVESGTAGYLVLNDPYQPWWFAEVDGYETPVLRANGLFRAVAVPSGSHRVRFVFRPFGGAWREALQRWPVLRRILGGTDARARGAGSGPYRAGIPASTIFAHSDTP
jgi:hypothetical protein